MMRLLQILSRDQRGYGPLSLALGGLMLASMLVIPFLGFVQDSLVSIRQSNAGKSGISCGATGIEHVLWRLQYDSGFISSLTEENPTSTYSIVCDGQSIPLNTTLSQTSTPPSYLSDYIYADVVMTLDVSLSINSSEMATLKQAAHEIVDEFNLAENGDRYRMGLTRFGNASQSRVTMTNDSATMHTGINNVDASRFLLGLGTNIVLGINGGGAQFASGLGDRPEIPNLILFMTDGDDSEGNTLIDIANAEDASGAEIFVVGIDQVFTDTLNAIASEPDQDHVFYVSNFEDLLDLIEEIVDAVNSSGLLGAMYDIEAVDTDGTIIQVRVLITQGGEIVIVSWEES
ncbi:MAG: VWA domain-containing protein [Chloroflexi bacterium]|nr:VWA domain-containing protein [Chloroflexota bacterium]